MKMTLKWHEGCLENLTASLDRAAKKLIQAQNDYYGLLRRVSDYRTQIARAIEEGKTDFDRDRFGKKRVKKEVPDDPTR
jgi:hypothetical protein